MDNQELTSLVRKSQEGETGAMEELLRAAYVPVSYQCRKFLRTGQDAEDITQEVLLLVYTKLDTLQEPAAFWGWLGRMTANRCKNVLSRTHTDLPVLEDEEGNSILDSIENEDRQTVPEEAFDNAETARMIEEIVDALPDAQRECVMLYYYDEMSVKEIAALVGASENTVKSRLNYARKAIKENVLDYEKKQGIRLHSIAPLSLLLYFLRRSAQENADGAAAEQMAQEVMAKGVTAAGSASGGAAAAGKAAGQAAHVLQGISLKAVGIAAGILIAGGAAIGILSAVSHDSAGTEESADAAEEDALMSETEETAENPAGPEVDAEEMPEEAEQEEAEEEGGLPAQLLAALPYEGDVEQCAMTVEQAEAFADVLEDCLEESQSAEFQYEAFAESLDLGFISREEIEARYTPFCKAALFDAGDGIPALWVTEAYVDNSWDDLFWYSTLKIYCWDGSQAVLSIDGNDAGDENKICNVNLTEQGLLVGVEGTMGTEQGLVMYRYAELYGLSEGMVSEQPLHILECFSTDGSSPGKEEAVRAYIGAHGRADVAYELDTMTEDKWAADADELSTMVNLAAVDGEFVQADTAFGKDLSHVFWWYAGEDYPFGQGQQISTDQGGFYWHGSWMDAQELASLLRADGTETP